MDRCASELHCVRQGMSFDGCHSFGTDSTQGFPHPMSPKNTREPKKASQFLSTTLSSEISAKLDYACKKSKIGFGAKLIDLNSGLGSSNRLSDMIEHLPASAALVSVTGTLHMRVSC